MNAALGCVLSLLLASFVYPAAAQELGTSPRQNVTVAPIPLVYVMPGKPSRVTLHFRVAPGLHVNSNVPKSPLLIPTKLKFDAPTDIAVGGVDYPPGKLVAFPFAPNEKLSVYAGDFMLTALVSATQVAARGTYRVRARLKYQACNDRSCFPPKELPLSFDVRIGKPRSASARRVRRNPGQSPHAR